MTNRHDAPGAAFARGAAARRLTLFALAAAPAAAALSASCAARGGGGWTLGAAADTGRRAGGGAGAPGPGAYTIDTAGVSEAYRRSFEGCNLTPQQDAVLRPAFRAWTESMARAIVNPVLMLQLLALPKAEAEKRLGAKLGPASEEYGRALKTLSPEQTRCYQENMERRARANRGAAP